MNKPLLTFNVHYALYNVWIAFAHQAKCNECHYDSVMSAETMCSSLLRFIAAECKS